MLMIDKFEVGDICLHLFRVGSSPVHWAIITTYKDGRKSQPAVYGSKRAALEHLDTIRNGVPEPQFTHAPPAESAASPSHD